MWDRVNHDMKREVMRQVAMLTAYHAAKDEHQEERCDRIPLIEADQPMMDLFWQNSFARLKTVITRRHVVGWRHVVTHRHVVGWWLDLARTFLVCDITAQWFSITLPEAENKYKADADAALASLRRAVQLSHTRKRIPIL